MSDNPFAKFAESDSDNTFAKYAFKKQEKPKPAEPSPFAQAAQEQSFLENLGSGIGGSLLGIPLGIQQLTGNANQSEVNDYLKGMRGLSSTGGGMVGQGIGAGAPLALVPSSIPAVVAASAADGFLRPTAEGESRVLNGVQSGLAGGLGQTAANAIGRVARPVQSQLTGEAADLATKAQQFMPLNAAQMTGSKPLKWIDSALDNLPFTADKQYALKLQQREAWQQKLLEQTGAQGERSAMPSVMGDIRTKLGAEFERITNAYDVPVDNALITGLAQIESKYGKRLTTNQKQIVQSYIDDLTANPSISGQTYKDTRSMLDKQARSMANSDSFTAGVLKDIRSTLDDAMMRTIKAGANPDDVKAWQTVNKNWSMLKMIEKAADDTTGNISPLKLYNEMSRREPGRMKYGDGDQTIPDLARIGKKFVGEQLPDSGSGQRSWYMNALQSPTTSLGGITGALTGGPLGALGGAALGAGTPLAMQKALWSDAGKKYLSNGLLDPADFMPYLAPSLVGGSVGLLNATK